MFVRCVAVYPLNLAGARNQVFSSIFGQRFPSYLHVIIYNMAMVLLGRQFGRCLFFKFLAIRTYFYSKTDYSNSNSAGFRRFLRQSWRHFSVRRELLWHVYHLCLPILHSIGGGNGRKWANSDFVFHQRRFAHIRRSCDFCFAIFCELLLANLINYSNK